MAPPRSEQALSLALSRLPRGSDVLDVGAGDGMHSRAFMDAGQRVVAIDLRPAPDWWPNGQRVYIDGGRHPTDYRTVQWFQGKLSSSRVWSMGPVFDLVWCSHVLEHLPDVGSGLATMVDVLGPDGILAITVPPMKPEIVGGHLSLWNLGLLAYRLILAGFDCSQAGFGAYGYNLSAIVRADELIDRRVLDELTHDHGDIERLAAYFPQEWRVKQGFNGSTVPNVRGAR